MPFPTPAARTSRCRPALLACLIAAGACAPAIKTAVDTDPAADLGRYRSFAWISADPLITAHPGEGKVSYVSPIDDQRIRTAVDAELTRRGYRQARTLDDADLVVSFTIGTEDRIAVSREPTIRPAYGRGYAYGPWYGGSVVRTYTYTEGTLTLQFFDRRTKRAVWVGWASRRLSGSDDRDEVIRRAVAAILERFPAAVL
jgi:hypothetical protein